jgi:hypothetical protein
MLTLKRASKSRPSGQWDHEDFDVFDGTRCIGRIMRTQQAPADQPWFWTVTVRAPQRPGDRGYAASQEQAMADFKAAWGRKPGNR